ncbi:MAG: choice-of-anchor E domain-containing protein [Dehalococcoidia bacterium]|nr:choice-of-anchor E domain-containing protein [Dehalococcoidia bacterium]
MFLAGALLAGGIPRAASVPRVQAAGCPVVSGFVYHDVNNNGLRDEGEPPIAGSSIELRTPAGAVVGRATTDANGYYQFLTDESANAPLQTQTHSVTFPTETTDWTATKELPQFDPGLGTLKSLTITNSGSITSAIKAESLDSVASTVSATVSGTLTVTAPGDRDIATVPTVNAGSFEAAAYDGVADFEGDSGHDFGSHTASDSNTVTLTDPASLAPYVGTGAATFTASVIASSRTSGSGNVLNQINTTAGAQLMVVYQYQPLVCLTPGRYNIVQTVQPPTYTDGRETAGNVSPIPGSDRSDTIPVDLSTGDKPNNNFGELRASLSGYVYVDDDNDGNRDQGEAPIPGVSIRLTGTDSSGATIDKTATTDGSGFYAFRSLLAGDYVIDETQPAAYIDGKDTIGSQGGKTSNDRHYDIDLPAGVDGVNNNFGERYAPTPTPTGTSTPPSGTPGTGTATGTPPGGGTGTPPGGGTGTPGGTTNPNTGGNTPGGTVAGARTPGVPGAGSGLFETAKSPSVIVVGLVIFAASGWLAFLALNRKRPEA